MWIPASSSWALVHYLPRQSLAYCLQSKAREGELEDGKEWGEKKKERESGGLEREERRSREGEGRGGRRWKEEEEWEEEREDGIGRSREEGPDLVKVENG